MSPPRSPRTLNSSSAIRHTLSGDSVSSRNNLLDPESPTAIERTRSTQTQGSTDDQNSPLLGEPRYARLHDSSSSTKLEGLGDAPEGMDRQASNNSSNNDADSRSNTPSPEPDAEAKRNNQLNLDLTTQDGTEIHLSVVDSPQRGKGKNQGVSELSVTIKKNAVNVSPSEEKQGWGSWLAGGAKKAASATYNHLLKPIGSGIARRVKNPKVSVPVFISASSSAIFAMLAPSGKSAAQFGEDPKGWWNGMSNWRKSQSVVNAASSLHVNDHLAIDTIPDTARNAVKDIKNFANSPVRIAAIMLLALLAGMTGGFIAYESYSFLSSAIGGLTGQIVGGALAGVAGVSSAVMTFATRYIGTKNLDLLIRRRYDKDKVEHDKLLDDLRHVKEDLAPQLNEQLIDQEKIQQTIEQLQAIMADVEKENNENKDNNNASKPSTETPLAQPLLDKDKQIDEEKAVPKQPDTIVVMMAEFMQFLEENPEAIADKSCWEKYIEPTFVFLVASAVAVGGGMTFDSKFVQGIATMESWITKVSLAETAVAGLPAAAKGAIGFLPSFTSFALYLVSVMQLPQLIRDAWKKNPTATASTLVENGFACNSMLSVATGVSNDTVINPFHFLPHASDGTAVSQIYPIANAMGAFAVNARSGFRLDCKADLDEHKTTHEASLWMARNDLTKDQLETLRRYRQKIHDQLAASKPAAKFSEGQDNSLPRQPSRLALQGGRR